MARTILRTAPLILLALMALLPVGGAAQEIRVTLLGTGAPPPSMERFGPSTLVEVGDRKFLIDAGRGGLQRLAQIGVRWQDVDGVFLTHLHSDHVVGFPDLWLTGWLVGPGRDRPLHVWGPSGTKEMIAHLEKAFAFDLRIRQEDDRAAPEGARIVVGEIREGVILDEGGLKITAFEVDHAPVAPAFGYRVEFAGRSVVFSGDTRASENLVRYARGVDLLVHEVVAPESFARVGLRGERIRAVIAHHTTPEQAGEIFAKAQPRLAVYSHIAQPGATESDLIPPTRRTYSGRVEAGEDLMVIEVGETIAVHRPKRREP
ncbi:MAG TPA: MBL fold metallo-hydrolase [Candidatus Eisenbacteria bacterium]|nr:MBL fold metallo-hydrolase [Candidatus Eisenbacteria bacterium]